MYHIFFIQSSVSGHLGCFHVSPPLLFFFPPLLFVSQILTHLWWRNWNHDPNSPPLSVSTLFALWFCSNSHQEVDSISLSLEWAGLVSYIGHENIVEMVVFQDWVSKDLTCFSSSAFTVRHSQPHLLDHETHRAEFSWFYSSQGPDMSGVQSGRASPANLPANCTYMNESSWDQPSRDQVSRTPQLTHKLGRIRNVHFKPQIVGILPSIIERAILIHHL